MSVVVSFEGYTPSPRYDGVAWTEVRIYEADTANGDSTTGLWTLVETIPLSPVDVDPANPATRNFTTELGTAAEQWYYLEFADATGDVLEPTVPVQNVADAAPYATVDELAAILKVNADTRRAALTRVLQAAALEIDTELGRSGTADPLDALALALVTEVNLERAVEHWQQMQSPFGVLGILGETGATYTARDSWDRHAHKLAPLKGSWAFA